MQSNRLMDDGGKCASSERPECKPGAANCARERAVASALASSLQMLSCWRLAAHVPLRQSQPDKAFQPHPAHLLAVGGANHHRALVGGVKSIQVAQQHAQHAPRGLMHLCSRAEQRTRNSLVSGQLLQIVSIEYHMTTHFNSHPPRKSKTGITHPLSGWWPGRPARPGR